jgi:hypothetical protein
MSLSPITQAPEAPSLVAITAHASAVLGHYCRIVVGDARFRADLQTRVSEVVLRWMASRSLQVALYGRRAWNSHLVEQALSETTTDFDLMVLDASMFQPLRFSILTALRTQCPDYSHLLCAYVKQHADARGSTMTVEIAGTPLLDLTMRDTQGDFCIGAATTPLVEPFVVTRRVQAPSERSYNVAVLRRRVMEKMLEAEIAAGIWRADRARKDLAKYGMFAAMGWFLPDDHDAPHFGLEALTHRYSETSSTGSSSTETSGFVELASEDSAPRSFEPSPVHEASVAPSRPAFSIDASVQLKLLRRHLIQSRTIEECRRCVPMFVCECGDPVHVILERLAAAKHLGEVHAIAAELK